MIGLRGLGARTSAAPLGDILGGKSQYHKKKQCVLSFFYSSFGPPTSKHNRVEGGADELSKGTEESGCLGGGCRVWRPFRPSLWMSGENSTVGISEINLSRLV